MFKRGFDYSRQSYSQVFHKISGQLADGFLDAINCVSAGIGMGDSDKVPMKILVAFLRSDFNPTAPDTMAV